MNNTEKIVISTTTLITSLLCYSYAKAARKEVTPYTMVGAFIGSLIGEVLVEQIRAKQTSKSVSGVNSTASISN